MNYTTPNDPDHIDDPKEWLNSTLIFAKALGHLLKERQGIVVELSGDMYNPVGLSKKVIVFSDGDQLRIDDMSVDFEDGDFLTIHKDMNIEIEEKQSDN